MTAIDLTITYQGHAPSVDVRTKLDPRDKERLDSEASRRGITETVLMRLILHRWLAEQFEEDGA